VYQAVAQDIAPVGAILGRMGKGIEECGMSRHSGGRGVPFRDAPLEKGRQRAS
jgi:hypothetical protein